MRHYRKNNSQTLRGGYPGRRFDALSLRPQKCRPSSTKLSKLPSYRGPFGTSGSAEKTEAPGSKQASFAPLFSNCGCPRTLPPGSVGSYLCLCLLSSAFSPAGRIPSSIFSPTTIPPPKFFFVDGVGLNACLLVCRVSVAFFSYRGYKNARRRDPAPTKDPLHQE